MKKFTCVLTVILLVFSMFVPVFASDPSPKEMESGNSYWVYFFDIDGYYWFGESTDVFTYDQSSNAIVGSKFKSYKWNGNSWQYVYYWDGVSQVSKVSRMIGSNHDIYYRGDSENVFFSNRIPPVVALAQPQLLPQRLTPTVMVLVGTGILILCLVVLCPRLVTWVPRLFLR